MKAPPIVEVACSFNFAEPIGRGFEDVWRCLKGLLHKRFPRVKETEESRWLLSDRFDYVIAVAPERFLVSWRKADDVYPRFSGERGVLASAIEFLGTFESACKSANVVAPNATMLELTKADAFPFADAEDIAHDLPILKNFFGIANKAAGVTFSINDKVGVIAVYTVLSTKLFGKDGSPTAWLEVSARTYDNLMPFRDAFSRLNNQVNQVFTKITSNEARRRFTDGGSNAT